MPSVLIEVRKQYTPEQEVALIEAVHAALREAFKIVPHDKNVRLVVHEPIALPVHPTGKNPSSTLTSASTPSRGVLLMQSETYTRLLLTTLSHLVFPRVT